MPLFQEVVPQTSSAGRITGVVEDSVAAESGLRIGDELLAINGYPVEDVIDVQYYGAEEHLELLIRRQGEIVSIEVERQYNQALGLEFEHPTFDTDIRRCNNLCEFCFVLQMAPKFRRTLYIKDDDYRYSFLFGHFVTLTNLSDHDWWRIETMRLSPLYVSVHVTDLELRRRFLRNSNAPDIMSQLQRLGNRGIELHTQLVVVPEFNDGRWLERSIQDLTQLWPDVRSISVVPVGLTKHHRYGMRPHTKDEAAAVLDYVESLQARFLDQFGQRFVYPTDEWYLITGRAIPPIEAYDGQELQENGLGMVRAFLDEWEEAKVEIYNSQLTIDNSQFVTLVTGTMFAPLLRKTAAEFSQLAGAKVQVKAITNERLGQTISAAGLLMGADIVDQLQTANTGDLVILPRVTFDHPDTITLDDLTPQEIANRLGKRIALADAMGDVWDATTGRSDLLYSPANPSP